MGSAEIVVPAWARPSRIQVQDLHTIAAGQADRSELARGCLDAVDWIVDPDGPTSEQAQAEAAATGKHRDSYHRGISDTLAWLCGWLPDPWHLEIPRRNPDGTLLTAEQLYTEALDQNPRGWVPTPEERDKAHHEAEVTAIRWARVFG